MKQLDGCKITVKFVIVYNTQFSSLALEQYMLLNNDIKQSVGRSCLSELKHILLQY